MGTTWCDPNFGTPKPDILPDILEHCSSVRLRPVTVEEILAAARSFKASTSSIDGLHPRQLLHLSAEAIQALTLLFRQMDLCGCVASEERLLARLIPQKAGGLRPIAIFRTICRVYAKIRVWHIRAWMRAQPREAVNVITGRQTLDAAWRSRVRDLFGHKTHALEIQMDHRKAFEQVSRARVLELARAAGAPLLPLFTSLLACRWQRRLVCGSCLSTPLHPTLGIAAGSVLAIFELELHLHGAIRKVTSVLPRPTVSIHVDDISVHVRGHTAAQAIRHFTTTLGRAREAFVEQLGLQFAPDKMPLVATSDKFGQQALAVIRPFVGSLAVAANRLGADYSLGSRDPPRRATVAHRRVIKHRARSQRLRALGRGRASPYPYCVGLKPVVTRGWELSPPRTVDLQRLIQDAVASTQNARIGLPVVVGLALLPTQLSATWEAPWKPIERLAREFWGLRDQPRRQTTSRIMSSRDCGG